MIVGEGTVVSETTVLVEGMMIVKVEVGLTVSVTSLTIIVGEGAVVVELIMTVSVAT